MLTSTVIWLGVRARGKTPGAKILSMLFSTYWIEKDGLVGETPQFRTANNFDFFRGEAGIKIVPDGPNRMETQTRCASKLLSWWR